MSHSITPPAGRSPIATRPPSLTRVVRLLGWVAVVGLLVAAFAPLSSASTDTGNNGTVKIHDGATDTEPIVHNEPHVCTFHLHFFFADPFQAGSWEIQAWSPGDKGTVVLSGTYDTSPSGEDRQPEQGSYTLPDGHYKLFWGGDTNKHDKMKVFWVDCAAVGATESPVAGTESPSGGGGGETSLPTGTAGTETEQPTGTAGAESEQPTGTAGTAGGGETSLPGSPGVNGGGPGVTQPPTDALDPMASPDPMGVRWLLVALAALLATVLGSDWLQRRKASMR